MWPLSKVTLLHQYYYSLISRFCNIWCTPQVWISNLRSTQNWHTWLSFSSNKHNYETSSSTQGNLMKLLYKTNGYGKYSITVSAVESWNKIQKQLKNMLLKNKINPIKLKQLSLIFILNHINNSLFYHVKI